MVNETIPHQPNPHRSHPRRVLRAAILSVFVAGAVAAWFCREPLRNLVLAKGVLLNNAPTHEAMAQVIDAAQDRPAAVRALWGTKKIVQREEAIRQLLRFIPENEPVPVQFETWILAAALDPDMNVRETALAILRQHKDPALAAICLA